MFDNTAIKIYSITSVGLKITGSKITRLRQIVKANTVDAPCSNINNSETIQYVGTSAALDHTLALILYIHTVFVLKPHLIYFIYGLNMCKNNQSSFFQNVAKKVKTCLLIV